MKALNMNIEQRARDRPQAGLRANERTQVSFVVLSYFLKLSMNFPVSGKALELAQLARVVQHVFTNNLSEKMCQAGVGLKQPPAQRNAICLVDNAVWIAVVQFL